MNRLRTLPLIVAVLAVSGAVYAASTFGVNKASRISFVAWDCSITADPALGVADNTGACSGAWSSRATSTSTSENITVTGAKLGDACAYVPGKSVAAVNQALDYSCAITAQDVATLRVTNASGGSLTPTTGRRGVMVRGLDR